MARTATALLPLLLLAGCASAGAGHGRSIAAGTPVTLAPGDTVSLPDRSPLTYVGVQNDSRCPPKVQCIQAGSAMVAFHHGGEAGHAVVLETGKTPGTALGAWKLTLVGLDFGSPPKATIRVDAAR